MNKIKSLVTGGAGFIGSNLVDSLLEIGHEVICIDNESSDGHLNFYWNPNCNNHKIDICEFEAIKPLFKNVDYVFHMAAESRIMNCIDNPIKAVKTNVLGTSNVLQASRIHNIKRLIYSSTSSAYGNNPVPNIETQPDDCLNPYSISKVCGEKLCTMYTKLFSLETIIFRYFNVYGNRQSVSGQYAPVIGLFLDQKKNNKPLTIVGDGSQKRDFTHVKDVVEANLLAMKEEIDSSFFGSVFNVGAGQNCSVIDLAKMISNDYIFLDKRPGEMQETLADNSKIRKILGWSPFSNLADYIINQL